MWLCFIHCYYKHITIINIEYYKHIHCYYKHIYKIQGRSLLSTLQSRKSLLKMHGGKETASCMKSTLPSVTWYLFALCVLYKITEAHKNDTLSLGAVEWQIKWVNGRLGASSKGKKKKSYLNTFKAFSCVSYFFFFSNQK